MHRIIQEFERFSRPLLHLIYIGLLVMLFFSIISYIENDDDNDEDSVTITYNCTYTLNNRASSTPDVIQECMNLRRRNANSQ